MVSLPFTAPRSTAPVGPGQLFAASFRRAMRYPNALAVPFCHVEESLFDDRGRELKTSSHNEIIPTTVRWGHLSEADTTHLMESTCTRFPATKPPRPPTIVILCLTGTWRRSTRTASASFGRFEAIRPIERGFGHRNCADVQRPVVLRDQRTESRSWCRPH